MKYTLLLSIFVIFLNSSFAQLINNEFENWDTQTGCSYEHILRDSLKVDNPVCGKLNLWNDEFGFGVSRTDDAYSGNHALLIYTWYYYVSGKVSFSNAISNKPKSLTSNPKP